MRGACQCGVADGLARCPAPLARWRAPGTFEAFLDHLPHVIKEGRNGRTYFQIRPDPPQ